jgi:DNA end-binding protein Ku
MRPIWKGSVGFGLVNIPIALYPATRHEELKFRLLRASDLSPVNYKRVAEVDGKEVPWDQIVKGYEYQEGKFVILKEDDFNRVDVEATQTVDITGFVTLEDIDPMFFHKPFYMEPLKGGAKAYALLHDALRDTGKVGIAKVVIKTRQYLAAVKPHEKGLLLELMHFADELAETTELNLPAKTEATKGEMEMAKTLIERMTEEWQPDKYKDEYRSAMMQLIENKIESGGRELPGTTKKAKQPTNVIDLAAVLKQSLSEAAKSSRKKKAGPAIRLKKAA